MTWIPAVAGPWTPSFPSCWHPCGQQPKSICWYWDV